MVLASLLFNTGLNPDGLTIPKRIASEIPPGLFVCGGNNGCAVVSG